MKRSRTMVSLRFKLELYNVMLAMVLLPLVLLFCDAAARVDMAEVAPIAKARRTLGSEPGELESEVVVGAPSPRPLSPRPAYATSGRDVQSPQLSPVLAAEKIKVCSYHIIVRTGDKLGADTDSKVSLRLRNPANEYIFFDSLDNGSQDKFSTSSMDFFFFRNKCILQICQMTLYTDDSGLFASWYPASVEVYVIPEDTSMGPDHQKWDVFQWLPTDRDDDAEAHFVVRDNCSN